MRVIGNAAMRELRADAVVVNWSIAEPDLPEPVKVKTFSSFRGAKMAKKEPVKGLWEKHGG